MPFLPGFLLNLDKPSEGEKPGKRHCSPLLPLTGLVTLFLSDAERPDLREVSRCPGKGGKQSLRSGNKSGSGNWATSTAGGPDKMPIKATTIAIVFSC
jgi:hypothetical protein